MMKQGGTNEQMDWLDDKKGKQKNKKKEPCQAILKGKIKN